LKDAKLAHIFTFSTKRIAYYIKINMHFAFISSFVAFLALAADAEKPSDCLLPEALPTLPQKDSPEGMMASPKGIILDAPKSASSHQYSLKLKGSDDAKTKALGFKRSSGQKIAIVVSRTRLLRRTELKATRVFEGTMRILTSWPTLPLPFFLLTS
jgi:hypothetical protein